MIEYIIINAFDSQLLDESIMKLKSLNVNIVYAGHGNLFDFTEF